MAKAIKKETPKKQDDAMQRHFARWKADTSYIKEYVNDELRPGDVLVRVYQYTPDATNAAASKLVDDTGTPLIAKTYRRIIPFAKVIKTHNIESSPFQDLAPGDIVTLGDAMASNKINPEWQQYQEMMKERPLPVVDNIPNKYVNRFSEWQKYLYITDKLKPLPTNADALTYIIPQVLIKTRKKNGKV